MNRFYRYVPAVRSEVHVNRNLRDVFVMVCGMVTITMLTHLAVLQYCPNPGFYRFIFLFPLGIGLLAAWAAKIGVWTGWSLIISPVATLLFIVQYVRDLSVAAMVTAECLALVFTAIVGLFSAFSFSRSRAFILVQTVIFTAASLAQSELVTMVIAGLAYTSFVALHILPVHEETPADSSPP